MAFYKYGQFLERSLDDSFEHAFPAAEIAPESGIYRCIKCSRELVARKGDRLPSHDHRPGDADPVEWRLILRPSDRCIS